MRKELVLCDKCKEEIPLAASGDPICLTFVGTPVISGSVSERSGMVRGLGTNVLLMKPGEFCSVACAYAALEREFVEAMESIKKNLGC